MIRFDQEAPAGGLDVYVQPKNGKAEITFVLYLTELESGSEQHGKGQGHLAEPQRDLELLAESEKAGIAVINIKMFTENGEEAARMCLEAETTETVACRKWTLTTRTLLIYPHLWNASEAPYLYEIKASITENHQITDTMEILCPICQMSYIPQKGFFLNDKPFTLHAVRYHVDRNWFQYLEKDLELLQELGANCICPDEFPAERSFYTECLKKGMIVWKTISKAEHLPSFCGDKKALLHPDRSKRESFYLYKACWSRQNVLYICDPGKITGSAAEKVPVSDGTTCVTVYSNQKRIALYVDGILHEFKESAPIFRFEDVPVKGEHTVISAQAGDRYLSVTL